MKKVLQRIGIGVLIAFIVSGCASFKESVGSIFEGKEELAHARELADRGEFSKAAEEYQLIIRKYPGSSTGGDALFELSLLYVSPRNKKKDFTRAYEGFQSFLEKYPKHQKAEMARYLFEVLKKVESLETEMKSLKEELIKLEIMGRELKR